MGIHHFEPSTTASWKRSLDRKRPLGYHSNSYSWKGKERTPPFGQTARVCTGKQTNLGFSEGILPRQLEFSFFDGEVNVNFEWSTFCALGRRTMTLQRAFATKGANFVEEDWKIWSACLDSLFFLGATLASKSRRNFAWDDRHREPQNCSSVAFTSRRQRWSGLQEKVLDADCALGGQVTCSASSARLQECWTLEKALSRPSWTTARDQPNDETKKGDPNVVEKQTSAGVLSDCRLFIQDVAIGACWKSFPYVIWRYWVWLSLQVLLSWSDEVDYGNDALHKVLSALTWMTPSPALEWKQNFSLYHCMKVSTFLLTRHTTFLSETQALILLSPTECTHFMTFVLLQCVHALSERGWWRERSIVRWLRNHNIR